MLEDSVVFLPRLRLGGEFFPTLCVAPLPPVAEEPTLAGAREALSALIATQLDTQTRLVASDSALVDAQTASLLRERFIAVLGHDLRNSLQCIGFGTEQLRRHVADSASLDVIARIERSCGRMTELIQNVLDFTRGKLGDGIPLTLERDDKLADELRHVIAEVQSAHVGRRIDVELQIASRIRCDRRRIAQLLANLLTNAVTHGAPDTPVNISIRGGDTALEIAVSNEGPAIPADRLGALFEPFSHGPQDRQAQGLGLGLFIAAQIAKAHGGTLSVASDAELTSFVFRMRNGEPGTTI